ncbi:hypothetical protein [Streptomyces sp. NPDC058861]|uniref:hypothetical protein n=1 Tax=Streptomyces sp. NPDC058861 TaxID=3346653 RepID=UPI00367D0B8C
MSRHGHGRIRLPLIAAHDGVDEAITQARSRPGSTTRCAVPHIAELLADAGRRTPDAGRIEEATAVLEQHAPTNSRDPTGHLVGLGLGRVQDALVLLQRHTSETRPSRSRPPHAAS